MKIRDRFKHAWNSFTSNNQQSVQDHGPSSSRPTHKTFSIFNASSYVSTIYNRIAIDAAMTSLQHVKINRENQDVTDMDTGLNTCLTLEANIDQSHIQFIHDIVFSMFDEGVVAVVPVDTSISPDVSGSYDIGSMRVGRIVNWFPEHVEVNLYNQKTGQNERIKLSKRHVAIIENPLYAVVNSSNSTLKRLVKKIDQLDKKDNSEGADRLDLIVSLPYAVKNKTQLEMAKTRIADIEDQLESGKHGVAYVDGTEKLTQLNRPITNQLPERVAELNQEFYNQLGVTQPVFNGTASELELRTYYSRTIDPILESIVVEFNRKFLTKTARSQGQKIIYYRDMFKTVPVEIIGNLGDALRRNYVATPNEIRNMLRLKHSNDPRADELFNPNISDKNQEVATVAPAPDLEDSQY